MRTTIDIPEETYRTIKVLAAQRGDTFKELVLEGLEMVKRASQTTSKRFELPVIRSSRPGSLALDNETIYDLLDLP
ncbi:MAG: hypothetical protein ABR976_14365 [Terracidiphilus sp.]|jgi:hypothetical protein